MAVATVDWNALVAGPCRLHWMARQHTTLGMLPGLVRCLQRGILQAVIVGTPSLDPNATTPTPLYTYLFAS